MQYVSLIRSWLELANHKKKYAGENQENFDINRVLYNTKQLAVILLGIITVL